MCRNSRVSRNLQCAIWKALSNLRALTELPNLRLTQFDATSPLGLARLKNLSVKHTSIQPLFRLYDLEEGNIRLVLVDPIALYY